MPTYTLAYIQAARHAEGTGYEARKAQEDWNLLLWQVLILVSM